MSPFKNRFPFTFSFTGVNPFIIELKAEKACSDNELKALAASALKQINDKKYDTEMKKSGVKLVYKYGVAFTGKKVEVQVST